MKVALLVDMNSNRMKLNNCVRDLINETKEKLQQKMWAA
ncbi:hypothetical protein yfred0001_19060 [Yersinia frederiksenii ATCC 33641]|nr:hypothetical protein yfred0001_19060 [Yersinia frederiksenii ATCC 33641]